MNCRDISSKIEKNAVSFSKGKRFYKFKGKAERCLGDCVEKGVE